MIERKIRPAIRLLCGGVGSILLMGTLASWRADYGLAGTAALGLVAGSPACATRHPAEGRHSTTSTVQGKHGQPAPRSVGSAGRSSAQADSAAAR